MSLNQKIKSEILNFSFIICYEWCIINKCFVHFKVLEVWIGVQKVTGIQVGSSLSVLYFQSWFCYTWNVPSYILTR